MDTFLKRSRAIPCVMLYIILSTAPAPSAGGHIGMTEPNLDGVKMGLSDGKSAIRLYENLKQQYNSYIEHTPSVTSMKMPTLNPSSILTSVNEPLNSKSKRGWEEIPRHWSGHQRHVPKRAWALVDRFWRIPRFRKAYLKYLNAAKRSEDPTSDSIIEPSELTEPSGLDDVEYSVKQNKQGGKYGRDNDWWEDTRNQLAIRTSKLNKQGVLESDLVNLKRENRKAGLVQNADGGQSMPTSTYGLKDSKMRSSRHSRKKGWEDRIFQSKRGWEDITIPQSKRGWEDITLPQSNHRWKHSRIPQSKRGWEDIRIPQSKRGWEDIRIPQSKRGWEDIRIPQSKRDWEDIRIPQSKRGWEDIRIPQSKRVWEDIRLPQSKRGWEDIRIPQSKRGWEDIRIPQSKRSLEEIGIPQSKRGWEEIRIPQSKRGWEEIRIPQSKRGWEEIRIPQSKRGWEEIRIPQSKRGWEEIRIPQSKRGWEEIRIPQSKRGWEEIRIPQSKRGWEDIRIPQSKREWEEIRIPQSKRGWEDIRMLLLQQGGGDLRKPQTKRDMEGIRIPQTKRGWGNTYMPSSRAISYTDLESLSKRGWEDIDKHFSLPLHKRGWEDIRMMYIPSKSRDSSRGRRVKRGLSNKNNKLKNKGIHPPRLPKREHTLLSSRSFDLNDNWQSLTNPVLNKSHSSKSQPRDWENVSSQNCNCCANEPLSLCCTMCKRFKTNPHGTESNTNTNAHVGS